MGRNGRLSGRRRRLTWACRTRRWAQGAKRTEGRSVTDRTISAGCVTAAVLWVLTAVLLAASWATGSVILGQVGLTCSAGAATATIRQFFVMQNKMMKNAFDLGRDSAQVRPMRRP